MCSGEYGLGFEGEWATVCSECVAALPLPLVVCCSRDGLVGCVSVRGLQWLVDRNKNEVGQTDRPRSDRTIRFPIGLIASLLLIVCAIAISRLITTNRTIFFFLERAGGLHVIILREEKGPRGPKYNARRANRTLDHNLDPTHNSRKTKTC